MVKIEKKFGGRQFSLETGRMAKQAGGAVLIREGDTMVLVAVVRSKESAEDRGFFPLSVDYREKTYAAGKIPGGFFKREGRPRDKEILTARLIDRPVRPLFPKGFKYEVQVMATVLSSDQEHAADILAITAASAALCISDIPFLGPIAGVRVGRVDDQFVINPTFSQLENSCLDLVIAGSKESIIMVEGSADELSEEIMLEAIEFGQTHIRKLIQIEQELIDQCGVKKMEFSATPVDAELKQKIEELALDAIHEANSIPDKTERNKALKATLDQTLEQLIKDDQKSPEQEKAIVEIIRGLEKEDMRQTILNEGRRLDSRTLREVRPITCEIDVLPRAHGSSLFTRGQTQSLSVATLGTKSDEQMIDNLEGETTFKKYMLHYNFPSFCVGETRPIRGPGRREIGHGYLAERSISAVIPSIEKDNFPYTIRLVSEILESNGSSSMASVCGGSLALMDAGVPIKKSVAGIAMGLIKDNDRVAVLSDILGVEDHLGDMDFKVAGTRDGVSGFQMDIKITGISFDILKNALLQAHEGRMHILDVMDKTISAPKSDLSSYAPRITKIMINPKKIGTVIGPGGKMIRSIQEDTGASIDIDDDGTVLISAVDPVSAEAACEIVRLLTTDPEEGKIYEGKVISVVEFGAFVEILPGREGLLHISELDHTRVRRVEDVLNEGEMVKVKLMRLDPDGKMSLSRKVLLERPSGFTESERPKERESRGGHPRQNTPSKKRRRGGGGSRRHR
ncbi:MAG: polyribonucleotide nucleotidyltransferase [Candidatus Cloacimonetes bacterium 4572_55]|nr:MAG: polyribonucleotide nucleotidyltransferase [Candidatus Cloacimonetes bacterium 4572_55]